MSAKPLAKRLYLCAILFLVSFLSKAQLVPQFSATPVSGCVPLVVNFHDETTGGPTYWKWDLGNSTISFLPNPSVTYFNPGTYTIKLVVQNATGKDSIIKTQYITVYALPTVNFTAAPVTGCYPLPVNFTDNSAPGSGTIASWLWDFGDGNTSTAPNPSHIYTGAGNYNVTLIITNSNGCTKSLTRANYISISAGVDAVFTNSVPTGCSPPETITFQNQSTGTGVLTYEWTFGDGGTSTLENPSHTYTVAGSYTVQLIVTNSNGCKDTATHASAINIGTVHADFTAPLTACAGTAITLTNTSTPTPLSVLWTFGDATSSNAMDPVKTYTTAGNYPIKLVADFGGCKDSVTKFIDILPKPASAFSGSPVTGCSVPQTVTFSNTSTGAASSQWTFGDGGTSTDINPSHTYTTPGTYTVTLITTNSDGCTDTLKRTDYIKIQLPVATINNLPQEGCAPFTWTFASTVVSNDPVVSYEWDFGDGGTSTLPNPTHIFSAGIYDIQLIITTANGCKDTVIVPKGIKASVKPVPDFSANPRDVCARVAVIFQDQSTGTNPTDTHWHWYFGDGSESTEQNPSHVYQDTGFFTVTLIVSNNGCADTVIFNNYVHIKPPIAIFAVNFDCADVYKRTFTDASIGADEWHWDFGDGNTSTAPSPVHTYAAVGVYTVTLTVVNHSTGCDYTKTASVTIADEQAAFTAAQTEICKNTAAVFTATSIHTPAAIINYEWVFGDGGTATGVTASHVYVSAGLYTVRLVITDVNGCRDTLIRDEYIKVNGPTANFTPSVPGTCLLTTVTFTDQSTPDGTHPINQWHWYYGDGTDETLTAPPFQHSYSAAGIYSVSLVVQDTYGCTDSIAKNNLLTISKPVAAFETTDTASCPGKPIVFTNTSTGPSLTYNWDFGDGNTSNQVTPTHTYSADGIYTVHLHITDQYGCTDDLTRPSYIKIFTPIANFTVNDSVSTCPPLIVQFTNTSEHMATYSWDFGDGNTSTAESPSHFYNAAGSFTATLTITSPGGCVSVKTKQMIVKGPSGTFSYTALTGCSPLTVNFVATTQARTSFIWDFNDGNTLATTDSVLSHTYTIPGVYVPKMILKDNSGCTVAVTGLDTIKVNGVTADFATDTLIRCNSGSVAFTNNTTSNDVITGYLWDFGDGNTSTETSPVHFYTTTGTYTATLTVTTQTGCTDVHTTPLPIKVVKTPEISLTQSPNGCVPLIMEFDGNLINPDTSAISWQWTFSDGTTTTGQHAGPLTFNTAGIYTATLIAFNSSGCSDTSVTSLEVYGKPNVVASNDISICKGSGQTISASGAATYSWSPAAGLSCTNCPSPIATPDSVKKYIVTGTSEHGCTNIDSVTVSVIYPFVMHQGPGDTLCKGQSTTLVVVGAASYQWTPTAGLNMATGPTVTATPDVTTTYMAVGFDGKGCFTDTAYFPVKVYPVPTVTAGGDRTINVGQTITLTPVISPDVTSVVWTPTVGLVSSNYPSITVKPTTDMQYRVSVTNPGGCTASALVNVFTLCNGANVYIPNTFSPNGDGMNDIFYPRGTGLFTIKQVRIFNRWGEEVFAKYTFNANDASAGWDGSYKGQKLIPDVYVYIFEILCENNSTLVYKGNIALIK